MIPNLSELINIESSCIEHDITIKEILKHGELGDIKLYYRNKSNKSFSYDEYENDGHEWHFSYTGDWSPELGLILPLYSEHCKIISINRTLNELEYFRISGTKISKEHLENNEFHDIQINDLWLTKEDGLAVKHQSFDRKKYLPPYLDKKHPEYAKEIDAAIQAYTEIIIHKRGNQKQGVTTRLDAWLRDNYKGESEAFYGRIKTVSAPKVVKK